MKYQVGDKIMMLHSGEEGHIVDFINPKMVMVEVDKVTFPVFLDQIDFPYFRDFSKKPAEKKFPPKRTMPEEVRKEKNSGKYQVAEGVWLLFLPVFDKDVFDDDIVEYFRISLVNQTKDHLLFEYKLTHAGKLDFELKNDILPLSDFYLHDVPLEDMNEAPKFNFDFILKVPDKKRAPHFEAFHKVRAKHLFQKVEEMRSLQQAHFMYLLFDTWPERVPESEENMSSLAKAGFKVHEGNAKKDRLGLPQSTVDLHIEKLTDDWRKISPALMLELQLKEFERCCELTVFHHQPKLIVIHGVGTGRLRDEIHQLLRYRKDVKSFVNQYHPLFGYGATEIYFQY